MIDNDNVTRSTSGRRQARRLAIGLAVVALAIPGVALFRALADQNDARPAAVASATTAHAAESAKPTPGAPATIPPADRGEQSYADIVSRVAPAVVTIRSERLVRNAGMDQMQMDPFFRQFFGDRVPRSAPRRQGGLGSGVIVSGDGYILTNNHVVEHSEQVKVELSDRRVYDAKVIGTDPPSDLAVLKIAAKDLPSIPLGNSDAARVGDVVLAFGNPLGVGQTVTQGILSAKGRQTGGGGDGSYEDFLQTDAPINQGNSGGALVNTRGELLGINSQILSPSGGSVGIGFAVPASMAKSVMNQLISHGRVRRAQLGVSVQTITSDLAAGLGLKDVRGALVSDVNADSPASRAGLRRGDVIVGFNGQPVDDGNELRNRVAESEPGRPAELTIVRDGHQERVTAKLGEQKRERGEGDETADNAPESGSLGIEVRPVTRDDVGQFHLEGTGGLVVENVDPAGRAADAGIQRGDVILEANHQRIDSVTALKKAVAAAKDRPVVLLVVRDGSTAYVAVETTGNK